MSEPLNEAAKNELGNSSLPVILPPVAVLLQRTQTALGLLRDVVHETSPRYWYFEGLSRSAVEDWASAEYAFKKIIEINTNEHWTSIGRLHLSFTLAKQDKSSCINDLICAAYEGNAISWQKLVEELSQNQWHFILSKLGKLRTKGDYPYVFEIFLSRALISAATSQLKEAGELLNLLKTRFIVQSKSLSLLYQYSGLFWYMKGEYDKALKDFNESVKIDAFNYKSYFYRGNTKGFLNDFTAVEDYKFSCKIDGSYSLDIYFNPKLKEYWRIIPELNKDLEINPNDIVKLLEISKIKNELQVYNGALSDIDKVIRLDAFNSELYSLRADINQAKQDYDSALSDIDTAIRINPNIYQFYVTRAEIKRIKHNYKDALSDLNKALEINSNIDHLYSDRAVIRALLGDKMGAVSDRQTYCKMNSPTGFTKSPSCF